MNPADAFRRRTSAKSPQAIGRKPKTPAGTGLPDPPRCAWAQSDPLLRAYHDEEWGIPERDSRALWEKLMLDGFQAGLSWLIILRKRDAFRRAFQGFDPQIVARFGPADVKRLLADAGIVRSRAKIEATIGNAQAYLRMAAAGEDFSAFVWGMVGGSPIRNSPRHPGEVPAKTALSEQMSVALKQRGFRFVGPVIVYAWMQATGLVDDHLTGCFRRAGAGGGKTRKTSA
jgi:DNA-3-methyladenine glycosylase I